jgi:hypothetical protein
MTMMNIVVSVVIAGILALWGTIAWTGAHPTSAFDSKDALAQEIVAASRLAEQTGTGATIEFVAGPDGTGNATLYSGRPFAAAPYTSQNQPFNLEAPVTSNGNTSFAILIAKNGSAGIVSPFTHGATVATQPTCSGTETLVVGFAPHTTPLNFDCEEARVNE